MGLGAEKPEAFFISVFKAEGGGNCSFTKASSWLLAKWVCSLISGARRQLLHFFFLVLLSFLWILTKHNFSFLFYINFLSGIQASGDVWVCLQSDRQETPVWWTARGRKSLQEMKFWNSWTLQVLIFAQIRLMRDESAGTETPDRTRSPLLWLFKELCWDHELLDEQNSEHYRENRRFRSS